MRPVKVFTDSTADLATALLEQYGIESVPLYVSFEDTSFRDGIDLTPDRLYQMVTAKKVLPRTSAPTPSDFTKAFQPWVEEGYEVVYIGLSSHLSSTLHSARIAAETLGTENVHVIDSLNLSTGIGLLVLKAAECAKQGKDAQTICREIEQAVPRVRTAFFVDTLEYIHMGGRCSAIAFLLGSFLKIRPLLAVEEGKLRIAEKYHGSRKQCLQKMLDRCLQQKDFIAPGYITVTHSACLDDAQYLADQLREKLAVKEVMINPAGCVISSHCGPKTIGILYIEKER